MTSKRYFARIGWGFSSQSLKDTKMGDSLIDVRVLENKNKVISSINESKKFSNWDDAVSYMEKKGYVETPNRWDWDKNMNPLGDPDHLKILQDAIPYFKTEDALSKIKKIRSINKKVFGENATYNLPKTNSIRINKKRVDALNALKTQKRLKSVDQVLAYLLNLHDPNREGLKRINEVVWSEIERLQAVRDYG